MKPLATLALLVTFVLLSIASSAEADHVRPDGRRRHASRAGEPEPECRMGTNGRQTCGYNCRMGTNGQFYCASRPDGRCAMNTDGTFSCP